VIDVTEPIGTRKPGRWSVAWTVWVGLVSAGVLLPGLALPAEGEQGTTATATEEESPPPPPKRGDAADLAERYVDNFMLRARLKAENDFLTREGERVKMAGQSGSPGRGLLDELQWTNPATRLALARVLQENAKPLLGDVELSATQLDEQVRQLRDHWLSLRTAVDRDRLLLFELKGSLRIAGQLASLLSVDKRWFWLFGVIAIAGLLGVVFHERRHEIRRLLNGGRARAMRLSKFLTVALAILALMTLATFILGDRIYESLLTVGSGDETSPRGAIAAETAAVKEEVKTLQDQRATLDEQYLPAEAAWRKMLTDSLPPGTPLASQWKAFRRGVFEINSALALLEALPPAINADAAALKELDAELGTHAEDEARYLRIKAWIRGALGLALVGLAAAGGALFWRGVRQRREVAANTCPLCLGTNKLQPLAVRAGSGGDGHAGSRLVQCKNVISRQPQEECGYTFLSAYRPMEKVCFPTLGIPQAGKTHWLTMLYWELNRGNYPKSVQFEKIKSQSSEDFDIIIEEILNARIGTAATQRERIPHPLVFNFQDRDALGRSNILVNIFDYSGEVTSDMGVEDYRRRRALEGDGFLFFLDPTYPSEPQAKALADFREDLRLIKGIKTGRHTRTPVALCVSKIDMMASQAYSLPGGGDAVERFYRELGEVDPTGEAMTMRVIEGRSRAMARLRETIWPGWQIERQIDDLFGGRYLFFPLTPVGLDGRGESDLSLRTISPFGLLEPMVWLLQMNGYPICPGP